MNKAFWKDFLYWLDEAGIGEIFAARDEARGKMKGADSFTRADLRRMIRLMDEELLTRSDLARLIRRKGAP